MKKKDINNSETATTCIYIPSLLLEKTQIYIQQRSLELKAQGYTKRKAKYTVSKCVVDALSALLQKKGYIANNDNLED